jgi:lysozyme
LRPSEFFSLERDEENFSMIAMSQNPDFAKRVVFVDISHHNDGPHGGPVDFNAVKASGVLGVVLKATQSNNYRDPTYVDRRKALRDAGLLVATYHFANGVDVGEQVDRYLSYAKPASDEGCWLDYEQDTTAHHDMSIDQAIDFSHRVDKAIGRECGLYSGNYIKEFIRDPKPWQGRPLWLAQYGNVAKWPSCFDLFGIQFSESKPGNPTPENPVHGFMVGSKLDLNTTLLSDADFHARWAGRPLGA